MDGEARVWESYQTLGRPDIIWEEWAYLGKTKYSLERVDIPE